MAVLLVGFGFGLPYRVLRCAAAVGLRVFVLGGGEARKLSRSRFCRGYIELERLPGISVEDFVTQVNQWAARLEVEMVLPADHETFRVLSMVRQRIHRPVFPLPDAEQFNILNDKYAFSHHCQAVGVAHPRTALFADPALLRDSCAKGDLPLPFVVKPANLSGGEGVEKIAHIGDLDKLHDLSYRPILAQQFIAGEDRCATLFTRQGKVIVGQCYRRHKDRVIFDIDDRLIELCGRLTAPLGVDGVINFDARIESGSGDIYIIECNPRFFFSMDYAAIAGVNFVALGLGHGGQPLPSPQSVSLAAPLHTLGRLGHPLSRPSSDDLRMLRHFLADPLPPLLYEEIPWRRKKWLGHIPAAAAANFVGLTRYRRFAPP